MARHYSAPRLACYVKHDSSLACLGKGRGNNRLIIPQLVKVTNIPLGAAGFNWCVVQSGPLSGRLVTIHCQAAARGAFASQKAAAEHRQSLQRLVRALGGRICGAKVAQLAVVAGVPALPCELPTSAAAVGEEWLLHLAETHSSETADNYAGFELRR